MGNREATNWFKLDFSLCVYDTGYRCGTRTKHARAGTRKDMVSSGTKRLAVSPCTHVYLYRGIKRYQAVSSGVNRCQAPLNAEPPTTV